MKAIRNNPIARATAWLLTAAMLAPMVFASRAASAQGPQVLRLIVADIENRNPNASAALGKNATDAVYNELVNSGQGRFFLFPSQDVLDAAKSLGIKTPTNPNVAANYSPSDLLRLAKNLNADGIIQGVVGARPVTKGHAAQVVLSVTLREVTSDELINGGYAQAKSAPRPGEAADPEDLLNKAVEDAAQDVVRQIVSHQLLTATVLNITGQTVILNRGVRDGVHVGDDMVILREGANGAKAKEATVHVVRAYSTDCEAEITQNIGGIKPEDVGRVLYHPPVIILPTGPVQNYHSSPFSMSAVGATLAAIGLGVLVASAARGGQTSVTNVVAEDDAVDNTAEVRISWGNNIFGQGGVQEYHIYRWPDFPYTPYAAGNNNGTGTTTTTTTVGAIPIQVAIPEATYIFDQPSPYFPYSVNSIVLEGDGDGNPPASGSSGSTTTNGTGGTSNGCTSVSVPNPTTLDTGFTAGKHYYYEVTAIILRQIASSSSSQSNGGTNGTTNGTGSTNSGSTNSGTTNSGTSNSGNSSGYECIETDPSDSQTATPIQPVQLTSPANRSASVNLTTFSPQWNSRNGADTFQVEVSLDSTFKTKSQIYYTDVVSTSPDADNVAQSLPTAVDLTQAPQLLANATFKAFVTGQSTTTGGTTATGPTIYWRVGARNDSDVPGPVDWISQSPGDSDRVFRWVYSQVFSFTPAPVPPPVPGANVKRGANQLNSRYLNPTRGVVQTPTYTNSTSASGTPLTPQQILAGQGKPRH